MSASNVPSPNHPDLRHLIAEQLRNLRDSAPEQSPYQRDFEPAELVIRCQRTWTNVAGRDQRMHGGDFSACVAQFEHEGTFFAVFFQAYRSPGSDSWQWDGLSGGGQGAEPPDQAGGFMLGGNSCVAVGGLGAVPAGGKLQAEHADGSLYEADEEDGCAIVFAPVTSEPSQHDEVIVRRFDADGSLLSEGSTWIGDGGPPPPEVWAAWQQRARQP